MESTQRSYWSETAPWALTESNGTIGAVSCEEWQRSVMIVQIACSSGSCSPTTVSVEEVAYHYYGGLSGDRRPDQAHHLACDGALLQHAVKYAGKRLVMLP